MIKDKALTTKELAHRWRGVLSEGTIENWRLQKRGPRFFKIGKGKTCLVLYKLRDIEKFEKSYFNGSIKQWQRLRSQ